MAYNTKILDHADNPRNLGKLDKKASNVGTGFVGNAACGDALQLQIQVENGIIKDVKSKTFGCGCAIAATSLATEKLIGKTLEEAKTLKNTDLAQELELPKIKIHCSVLAEEAVKRAIEDYTSKQQSKDGVYELTLKDSEMTIVHTDDKLKQDIEKQNIIPQCSKTQCSNSAKNIFDKPIFNLTANAFNRFSELLSTQQDAIGIKVFCEAGGCAGNSYNLEIITDNIDHSCTDLKTFNHIQNEKQITFFVPKTSLMFLLGITIDYTVTTLSAEFKFYNPGAKSCGCGASFR